MRDPHRTFRYMVEVDGTEIGGFSQVAGLERSTEVEDFREGGVNDFTHKLVTNTKYGNLTLRRGISSDDVLWQWHQNVIEGRVERKSVSIVLQDERGDEALRWVFSGAYPVKWTGTDLDAATAAVAVESVEFAHHGMSKE